MADGCVGLPTAVSLAPHFFVSHSPLFLLYAYFRRYSYVFCHRIADNLIAVTMLLGCLILSTNSRLTHRFHRGFMLNCDAQSTILIESLTLSLTRTTYGPRKTTMLIPIIFLDGACAVRSYTQARSVGTARTLVCAPGAYPMSERPPSLQSHRFSPRRSVVMHQRCRSARLWAEGGINPPRDHGGLQGKPHSKHYV